MTITSLTNTDKEIVRGGMFNSGSMTKPSKSESHNTEPLNIEPSKPERLWIGDWLENGCREFAGGWVYDATKNKVGPQPYDNSDRSPNAELFRKKRGVLSLKPNEQYE